MKNHFFSLHHLINDHMKLNIHAKYCMYIYTYILIITITLAASAPDAQQYTVVLTGFGPFMNYTHNPSGEVAQILDGQCVEVQNLDPFKLNASMNVCFEGHVIPVNHSGASLISDLLREGKRWDAIVHIGLEDKAKGLKIETMGANILAESEAKEKIYANGPDLLAVSANLGKMTLPEFVDYDNQSKSIDVSDYWSRDAGTYYCNETLYRTLYAIRTLLISAAAPNSRISRLLPAVFVHLPDESVASAKIDSEVIIRIAASLLL